MRQMLNFLFVLAVLTFCFDFCMEEESRTINFDCESLKCCRLYDWVKSHFISALYFVFSFSCYFVHKNTDCGVQGCINDISNSVNTY